MIPTLLLAASLFGALASAAGAAPLPPLPDIRFSEIPAAVRTNYQGDRFSYMEAGRADAPVLLLLHGVGANSMHWRHQLAGLSDRYRVIAWNAPGYFLTDGFANNDPGCRDFADAVRDFLASLAVERVNILGNSFGSRVAQCFAMHYPDRLIRLAMTGTGIGPKDMPEEARARIIATRESQIAKGFYGFGARVSALLGPNAPPELAAEVQRVLRATQPRGFMHGVKLGLVNGYSPDEVGAKVTIPVLMIQGTADRVNPSDKNADILIPLLKNGRLEKLDAIGHLPEVEAPDTVNRMLLDFFG
jgi:pimeloyl-ACP methyl ester carboxylesterase